MNDSLATARGILTGVFAGAALYCFVIAAWLSVDDSIYASAFMGVALFCSVFASIVGWSHADNES